MYFVQELKARKLANRAINLQMKTLKQNIEVLELIEMEYGSLDNFITKLRPNATAALFACKESPYALKQIGFALALKQIIDSTKTKNSNRTLPMSKDVERILHHARKLQAENKMKLGPKYHRDLDLVFPREDGYFTCDTTFRDFVNKRLKEAGIEHHKIHSFRHSCATSFFEQKADIKKVSKWLGHSCIGITLDTYTHSGTFKVSSNFRKLLRAGICEPLSILLKFFSVIPIFFR